ncbi:MAG: hypothetical protein J0L87_08020 [Bacteroidetes bacterium]|nr:hypothetical protein [Bacteroidota bacterium]
MAVKVFELVKSLFWEDKINVQINLMFLAINLLMTSIIYTSLKGCWGMDKNALYVINGFDLIAITLSVFFVFVIQSIILNSVLFICQISKNIIIEDFKKYAIENNLQEMSPFREETKTQISDRFYKTMHKFSKIVLDKEHLNHTIKTIFFDNGIKTINKVFVVISIIIFINPNDVFSETAKIITIGGIYVIMIILTIYVFVITEYVEVILPNLKTELENNGGKTAS